MEIEKVIALAAPAQRVWELLLNPEVMGKCVPGMQSIEVVSDTEYNARIHVKLAFISAKFKIKTLITQQTPPTYLCSESTGEDASVASSLKSVTELFLTEHSPENTELRVKVKVDLLGRLGSLGMSAMKTKADRMWDEFGKNLAAQLNPPVPEAAAVESATTASVTPDIATTSGTTVAATAATRSAAEPASMPTPKMANGWWQQLFAPKASNVIRVDIRRGDTSISIEWPESSAKECAAWLQDYLKKI